MIIFALSYMIKANKNTNFTKLPTLTNLIYRIMRKLFFAILAFLLVGMPISALAESNAVNESTELQQRPRRYPPRHRRPAPPRYRRHMPPPPPRYRRPMPPRYHRPMPPRYRRPMPPRHRGYRGVPPRRPYYGPRY